MYEDILEWWVNDPQNCNLNVGDTPIQRTHWIHSLNEILILVF
jgi:hypothetical protein